VLNFNLRFALLKNLPRVGSACVKLETFEVVSGWQVSHYSSFKEIFKV
jgi:hypothetical protein